MEKYTFKMSDRMKFVVERPQTSNTCIITISGKTDTSFRFTKKRAGDLVQMLETTMTYGVDTNFDFRQSTLAPKGRLQLIQPTTMVESYMMEVFEGDKPKYILHESGISKKTLKKMVKVMREVFDV